MNILTARLAWLGVFAELDKHNFKLSERRQGSVRRVCSASLNRAEISGVMPSLATGTVRGFRQRSQLPPPAKPLRTTPSMVAGHPELVQSPARNKFAMKVAAFGRMAALHRYRAANLPARLWAGDNLARWIG
jgi:hypothetical protein